MKIHPTAIVDPKAELHESVEVGPYSIIEAGVKVGKDTKIRSCVLLYSGTQIGKNNEIFHGAALGGWPQDLSFRPEIESYLIIGDNNIIRENTLFHRSSKEGGKTIVGDNNYFMGDSHVGHDCIFGHDSILTHGTVLAGHVTVGNYVFISGLAAIHQHCHVGDYAMVAGLAKVVQDVPPYSTVDGNPSTVIGINSVGLKRAGLSPDIRNQIKSAYKTIYHSKQTTRKALEELKSQPNLPEEVKYIVRFFEASSRGVTDHR